MPIGRSDVMNSIRGDLNRVEVPGKRSFGDTPPPAGGGAVEKAAHRTAGDLVAEHAHLSHEEAVPAIIARVREAHPDAQVSDGKLGVRIRRGLRDHAATPAEYGTAPDDDSAHQLGESLRRLMG